MRIAVVHPHSIAKWVAPIQTDGLHAAFREIAKKHTVDWYLGGDLPEDKYDWILPWGVGSLPFNNTIENYKARKALLCAGHPQDTANFEKFEAIFVESPAVYDQVRAKGFRTVLAFGTDTDMFKPMDTPKIFDAFYPATFSPWKRQEIFAQTVKASGMACGYLQPDGGEQIQACEENKTHTMVGLVPSLLIAQLYNMSRVCLITSWHGSERTALEAMASNIPLIITSDNVLTSSLKAPEALSVGKADLRDAFLEMLGAKVNTRDYILDKYSHHHYAKKILEVLEG